MPILRYTASADTTIVDAYKPYTTSRAYYANMGAADSLEIFSIYHTDASPEISRILVKFPIQKILEDRQKNIFPNSGSVRFIFKLYNVEHPETLPKNYYASVMPISSSWDEGYGLDLENYSYIGQTGSEGYGANWIYRNSENDGTKWTSTGGDYLPSYEKSFYFDNGTENLSVDVTDIIEDQLSGLIPPHGLSVMFSGSYENGANNSTYYTKRFSARSSEYFYNVPQLETQWESLLKDDRGDFYYYSPNISDEDNIQNIYFYNKVNGSLKDLPNLAIPFVKIYDESSTLLTSSIQAEKVATGTYKASFFITGSEEQFLRDVWYSGSNNYFTSLIDAKIRIFDNTFVNKEAVFSITNLKNTYKTYEKPTIRIFGRYKDWSPNIYKIASKEINTLTFKNLYYKIFRIVDGLIIVDYGIDPVAYSLCSYDKDGNYFDIDMSMFQKGYGYGIKLMLLNGDTKVEIPDVFRFKVE